MNWKMTSIRTAAAVLLLSSGLAGADDVRELGWGDLIPEEEKLAPAAPPPMIDHSAPPPGSDDYGKGFNSPAPSYGVVEELDKEQVMIPGFVVPLEVAPGGKVSEFLLVPYFGACIHYPPPPPNQIVYVTMSDPVVIDAWWNPIWVYGEMTTKFQRSEFGSAGYSLTADKLEPYEY